MSNTVPAFHTKAAEASRERNDRARAEWERADRFLHRIDDLLAELSDDIPPAP